MFRLFGNRHSRYQELLTEHVDGRLDDAGEAELQRHLDICETCTTDLREMQAVVGLLRAQPQADVPRSFALPYAPRQEDARGGAAERRGFMRTMQVATAAAALTLVALIGVDLGGVVETRQTLTVMDSARPAAAGSAAPQASAEAADGAADDFERATAASPEEALSPPTLALPAPAPAQSGPVPVELLLDNGRSAFRWAEIALGILTAAMALGVVGLTWTARAQGSRG